MFGKNLKTKNTHLEPLKKFSIRKELTVVVSKILHRNQRTQPNSVHQGAEHLRKTKHNSLAPSNTNTMLCILSKQCNSHFYDFFLKMLTTFAERNVLALEFLVSAQLTGDVYTDTACSDRSEQLKNQMGKNFCFYLHTSQSCRREASLPCSSPSSLCFLCHDFCCWRLAWVTSQLTMIEWRRPRERNGSYGNYQDQV